MYHFKEVQSLANRISTLILVLFLGTVLLIDCTGMPTTSLCIKFDTNKKEIASLLSVRKLNEKTLMYQLNSFFN